MAKETHNIGKGSLDRHGVGKLHEREALTTRGRDDQDGSDPTKAREVGTQLVLVGVTLAFAQSFALYINIRRYVTGAGSVNPNLDSGAVWWWSGPVVSPMTLWFIGSAAFTALLFVLLREMRKTYELAA